MGLSALGFSGLGSMALGCGQAAPERALPEEQSAERVLEQLQRVSPLQRRPRATHRGHGASQDEEPPAAPVTPSEPEDNEAPLPSVDAGAAPPSEGEALAGDQPVAEPPLPESDAGAPAVEPPAPPEAADAGPAAPPRDIVAEAALPIHALVDGQLLTEAELWQRLEQAPVICFGELHNRVTDHYAEARALAELIARGGGAPLALGMEMFQRPFQAPLTAYVQGELDEAGMIEATEYVARWGYDFAFYRPLLEAARSAGLPVLALNAPRELTRTIGRTGLESLDESERAQVPELDLEDAEHREFIFGLLGAFDHDVQLALENIYVAQTVWDETMAESSASWLSSAGPEARLLIVAGAAHCHESAIPRRIERRLSPEGGLEVTSLAVALASELGAPGFTTAGYDVLIVLEDVPLSAAVPPELLRALPSGQ